MSTNDFTDNYKKKIDSLQILYRFKGSVNTLLELHEKKNNTLGDVWNCKEDSKNYCWNREWWVDIGLIIDLSNYSTTTEINAMFSNVENKLIEHKYTTILTTKIEAGGEITLPANYKVR